MAGVVVMVHRRNSVIHDGLGGKAAVAAVKQGKERASSNAVDLFGEGGKPKGPKWADVRKRLEDKGVLSDALFVSDQREKEIGEIVAEAEYQPLFTRLQETIRQNVLYKTRLHRHHLAERLVFEAQVATGTIRLMIFIFVFWMFWAALILSTSVEVQRGIFTSLDASLNFEALRNIKTRQEFHEVLMPTVSEKSKKFFLLSPQYFKTSPAMARGTSSMQLLGETRRFTRPIFGPVFTLLVPEYTWTVWVKPKTQFVRGYLLRKRPIVSGYGSDLSCWGIFLDKDTGPAVRFAGHEYFALVPPGETITDLEISVGLNRSAAVPLEEMFLLTVSITPTEVTFYRNLDILGSSPLPLAITDCFNNDEGVLMGSAGLEMASLRFYPYKLTRTGIEEIYVSGGLLSDLSRGTAPPERQQSETAALFNFATSAFASVEASVAEVPAERGISDILNSVEDTMRKNNFQVTHRSAVAPVGAIPVNLTLHSDESGRKYTSIYRDAARLTSTQGLTDQQHRHFTGMPDFNGTGFTLSFWYRHMPCATETCGIYLFEIKSNHTGEAPQCLSMWLENKGHWWDNKKSSTGWSYPLDYLDPKYRYENDINWRHTAWVWDETSDEIAIYMDGYLAHKESWGSVVAETAECAEPDQKDYGYGEGGPPNAKVMTWGRATPGYRYGAEVETYDIRMYVHDNGNPLGAADVLRIADAPTPGIASKYRCLKDSDPLMGDTTWKDAHNHGCSWYNAVRKTNSLACDYEQAASNCPIACRSRQECFTGNKERAKVFFIWDSIRRIEQRLEAKGTVCLGDHLTKSKVVEDCKAWVNNGGALPAHDRPEISKWLYTYLETTKAGNPRLNITSCLELEESIDEYCSFNTSHVREFTEASKANNKDFTMAMWVRPTGTGSLHPTSKRFFPGIHYYGTLSPPQPQVSWGKSLNPNGEVRIFTKCQFSGQFDFENIEMKAAETSGWTFLSISRRSSDAGTRVVTSGAQNYEEGTMPMCYYDEMSFFNAIEINQPMLISPIMLIPEALPFSTVQELYYANHKEMSVRWGPQVTKQEREMNSKIQVEKDDFSPRSTLLSAPIIFQTRRNPSNECPFNFSTEFLSTSHDKVVEDVCASPFECEPEIMTNPEKTLACPGNESATWAKFSLDALEFGTETGYGDILYSITDSPFLFRDGRITGTDSFIDSMSSTVKLFLVFFTPRAGITSLMTVTADFMGDFEATVDVRLDHYAILEGEQLRSYLAIQVLCIVLVLIMGIDAAVKVYRQFLQCKPNGPGGKWTAPNSAFVLGILIDMGVTLLTCTFISIRIPAKVQSAPKTREIVGAISAIDWGSEEVTLNEKKATFFALVQTILKLIDEEQNMQAFANWILILSMLRIVQATGLHPRLGILTGTVRNALDDLMHAGVLIGVVNCCLAAMGYWRFGSERADFGNLGETFATSLEMLLGNLPNGWSGLPAMQLYILIFVAVVFFLVQNFLLAIIVEAYMTVRGEYVALETEQQFPVDVWSSFQAHIMALWYGWPMPYQLGTEIYLWESRYSVSYQDLARTGLFRKSDGPSIGKFLKHYSKFDFLQVATIRRRAPCKPGLEIVDEIERRVSHLLGKTPPTLRDMAVKEMQKHEQKVAQKAVVLLAALGGKDTPRISETFSKALLQGEDRASAARNSSNSLTVDNAHTAPDIRLGANLPGQSGGAANGGGDLEDEFLAILAA